MTQPRPLRQARILLRRQPVLQVLLLLGLWWLTDAAARALALPVPGSVIGLGLLLALLASGALPAACLQRGAGFLTGHLMLFFIPPMLALRDHPELLSATGAKLLLAVGLGTLAVMAGTGLVVELAMRRLAGGRHA